MASSKVDKKRQLLSMKYNQRSQVQFEFTEQGKCGRRGRLWESLPSQDKKMVNVELEDKDGEHHLVWSHPPTNILVIKKFKDVGVTRKFKELTTWLVKEKMLQVTVEPSIFPEKEIKDDPEFSEIMNSFSTWSPDDKESQEEALDEIDLIICVGGDGTLLYTSSMFQENFPPIMSFHLGSLGFLTPFQFTLEDNKHLPSSARNADGKIYRTYIEKVLKGGVSLTLRHRLECKISTMDMVSTACTPEDVCLLTPSPDSDKPRMNFTHFDTKDKRPWASKPHKQMLVMNDLVVDRGPNAYLTNLLIKCNGRPMTTVQGDGVIIATPTGSTAYSLAAGASMVHPSVPCMVVTPICPHSLSFRSIVVPSGVELEITLSDSSRSSAWVSFDGRNRQEISKGESVVVSTCKWPIPSINNTGHVTDWFDSLSECLHWNVRKEQKQFSSS